MSTLTSAQRRQQIWSVIRVSSGNFLGMYDFFVFGYYATAIGKVFFPTGSEFASNSRLARETAAVHPSLHVLA